MPRSFVQEARKRVGPKRERIRPVIERLAVEHADAAIALKFESALELLISVMLSAQTTDVSVNKVTATLFQKYRRPEDYLAVPQEELERDIFATGFYRQKAKSLRGTMRMLIEEFDGEVPATLNELVRLPGVARKTANVVSSELGHPEGVVVDTHVRRLSQRLGFTKTEDPAKSEGDLVKLGPRGGCGCCAPPFNDLVAGPSSATARGLRGSAVGSAGVGAHRRSPSPFRGSVRRASDQRVPELVSSTTMPAAVSCSRIWSAAAKSRAARAPARASIRSRTSASSASSASSAPLPDAEFHCG